MATEMHTLEIDGIYLQRNYVTILSDIYLNLNTGTIIGILGRNGQGKSTLFEIIYGIIRSEKSVRFDNVSIVEPFRFPEKITFLPQYSFLPGNLKVINVFSEFYIDFQFFSVFFPSLDKIRNSRIDGLSGGERRLIEVFIIIMSKSFFSILDEPFSHISPVYAEIVCKILETEKKRKGFLITDQCYPIVTSVSEKLFILKAGKMHEVKEESDLERFDYLNSRR